MKVHFQKIAGSVYAASASFFQPIDHGLSCKLRHRPVFKRVTHPSSRTLYWFRVWMDSSAVPGRG